MRRILADPDIPRDGDKLLLCWDCQYTLYLYFGRYHPDRCYARWERQKMMNLVRLVQCTAATEMRKRAK